MEIGPNLKEVIEVVVACVVILTVLYGFYKLVLGVYIDD